MLLGTAGLAGVYAWLARTRPERPSRLRTLAFAGSLLVLLLALLSPIDVGGDHYLFSLHMLQHILLSMVVPPLFLLGVPASWLPVDRLRPHPLAAALVFNGVVTVWHLPALYDSTLRNDALHVTEHLSFLLTGMLFWWPIVSSAGRRVLTPIGKIGYLAFAGVPPTILGLVFILSRTVLYPFYAAAPRVTGLSPLEDQQLAGLVMFGLGNLIYFVAIWIVFFGLDAEPGTAERAISAKAAADPVPK